MTAQTPDAMTESELDAWFSLERELTALADEERELRRATEQMLSVVELFIGYSLADHLLPQVLRPPLHADGGWRIPTVRSMVAAAYPQWADDEELNRLAAEVMGEHLAEDLTIWQDLHARPWHETGAHDYIREAQRLMDAVWLALRDEAEPYFMLSDEHQLMLLKLGHSLRLSGQVAWTVTQAGGYPTKLYSWAKDGLGRPGPVTGIRYDFAALLEDQMGWSQVRPDKVAVSKKNGNSKYIDGENHRLMAHPLMVERHRAETASTLMLVEGTNQHLAAVHVHHEDENIVVLGMASCTGWSRDGYKPIPDLMEALRPANITHVVIAMDADQKTNPGVNEAARKLGNFIRDMEGKRVKYMRLDNVSTSNGNGGKDGLDDYIGSTYRVIDL